MTIEEKKKKGEPVWFKAGNFFKASTWLRELKHGLIDEPWTKNG